MKLDRIRIVLVGTSHPGNIGSTARAMKTMGIHRLYLVNPHHFPAQQAVDLAAGADDILHAATITTDLASALNGCHLVLGTSARSRAIDLPGLTPRTAASLVQEHPEEHEIAIVFGREHAGLTNDELLHCHYHIHIPTNPTFSSLNLAQAVQIITYELRLAWDTIPQNAPVNESDLAPINDVEQFYEHLHAILIAIDFLKPSNPRRLMQRIRRMFNRIKLEKTEINILRGILSNIQRYGQSNEQSS